MDKKIEKKKWTTKRILYIAGVIAILILSFYGIQSMNKKVYKLDRNKITVKTITTADFQDIILIDGTIEPITSVFLNTPEGGTVEEVFVEDGAMVKKGTPLVKLSNPSVMLGYMTQETAIVEQINNLRNLKLSLEKDQRVLRESLIDIEYQLTSEKRNFQIDTILFGDGVIARNSYDDRKDAYDYKQKKRAFLEENFSKTAKNNNTQIDRINRSIDLMERNLEVIHENMGRLLVRAPVTGRLSSFDLVIGESFAGRETIGKIDLLAGFKVQGLVDEYYLSTVKSGLAARFSFDGKMVELKVKKVLPEVINGRFEIEMVFVNEPPKDIRTGLSSQVRLELSEARQALLIPRGNFFQASGGQYVFVVKEEEQGEKRYIRIGRQNPSYYEVLEGLNEGEQVITSSYEAFKDYDIVEIIQ